MAKSKKCPTPYKQAHPNRGAAVAHSNGLYKRYGKAALVHPYECRCGAWHVGGRRKSRGPKRKRY